MKTQGSITTETKKNLKLKAKSINIKTKKSSAKNPKKDIVKKQVQKSVVRIDSKKVFSFVRGLSPAEANFLSNLMNTRFKVQALISATKITKKEFCDKMEISVNQYRDFVLGSFNYSINHLVKLGCLQYDFESKDALDNTINGWVSVPKD